MQTIDRDTLELLYNLHLISLSRFELYLIPNLPSMRLIVIDQHKMYRDAQYRKIENPTLNRKPSLPDSFQIF